MGLINPAAQSDAQSAAKNQPRTNMDNVEPVEGQTDDLTDVMLEDAESASFEDAIAALEGDTGLDLSGDLPEGVSESSSDGASQEADQEAGSEPESSTASEEADEPEAGEREGNPSQSDSDAEHEDADAASPDDEAEAADPDQDAEADEDATASSERAVDQVLSELTDEYDDFHAENLDDLAEQFRLERESNDTVVSILEEHPQILNLMTAIQERRRAGEPVDVAELASEHIPEMEAPDPQEDPEGYKEWADKQAEKRAQRAQEQQQLQQVQREIQELRQAAQAGIEKAAEELDLSEDQARQQVAQVMNQPAEHNMPFLLLRGMQYKSAIEAARDEAFKEGRKEAIQQMRQKQESPGDGIPDFTSQGGNQDATPDATTEEDEELAQLAHSWNENRDPLAQFLG